MQEKSEQIKALDNILSQKWEEFFNSTTALNLIEKLSDVDQRIYALYMLQVYHWSSQSARTLALAGANKANTDVKFMMHCFEHANEETGHELMALNDVISLGVPIKDAKKDIPPPLHETEILIVM